MSNSLEDRMKANYELRQRPYLIRRMPVIIRVDGRAFHTFTRGCEKPFDEWVMSTMREVTLSLVSEIQGCVAGYTQSDEASFLLIDYATQQTDAWFGYNQQKLTSITASMFTAEFNNIYGGLQDPAVFDARAFNVPREEVANYFLWRAQDWHRNSVSMLAQSLYSHKELHGKDQAAMHEMIHDAGKNWADLKPAEKNGTWFFRDCEIVVTDDTVQDTYDQIAERLDPFVYCDETPAVLKMPGCDPPKAD